MPKGPVLTVVITSVSQGLDKGLKDASSKLGDFGESGNVVADSLAKIGVPPSAISSVAKMAGGLTTVAKVAAPIAGVAAVVAKLGDMGDKANTAMAGFDIAMKNAGASAGALDPAIAGALKSSKDMAFSSQAARDSLVSLQTATGDTAKSAELLAVAQDVARLSGADLSVASDAVAKAYAGQDRQLRALVPGMAKTKTGLDTIAEAEKLAAGQADNFAGSAEGMGIKTAASLKGIAVSAGKTLAPAMREMLAALMPVVEAFGELLEAVLPLLLPLLSAVAKAFTIAAKAVTAIIKLITRLISKIRELLQPLNDVIWKLQQLNPFKGVINQVVNGTAVVAGTTTMATRSGGGAKGGAGGVTINIYGDPAVIEARVIRALKSYQQRNGVASLITAGRW